MEVNPKVFSSILGLSCFSRPWVHINGPRLHASGREHRLRDLANYKASAFPLPCPLPYVVLTTQCNLGTDSRALCLGLIDASIGTYRVRTYMQVTLRWANYSRGSARDRGRTVPTAGKPHAAQLGTHVRTPIASAGAGLASVRVRTHRECTSAYT